MRRRRITMEQYMALVMALTWAGAAALRARCPSAAEHNCTLNSTSTPFETFYIIHGQKMRIYFNEGDHFLLSCNYKEVELVALPRFEREVSVALATLDACPPPAAGYAALFAALNVSAPRALALLYVPSAPPLSAAHLRGLPLVRLDVAAKRDAPQRLDEPALALLDRGPADLRLRNVRLARLPLGVRHLRVAHAGLAALPVEALADLETLYLEDAALTDARNLSAAPRLRELTLVAPVAAPPAPPALHVLSLQRWPAERPPPWVGCGALRDLTLVGAALRRLPADWLAECAQLRNLTLRYFARLEPPPERLLRGVAGLERLEVRKCSVKELPDDFFSYTPELISVDLTSNLLTCLPRSVSSLRRLRELRLRDNRLSAGAAAALSSLRALRVLVLSNNALGDLCGPRAAALADLVVSEESPLAPLTELSRLELSNVNATRVCADWRRAPLLDHLDLTLNHITQLQYEDLRLVRRSPTQAVLLLAGNGLESILYDEQQYEQAVTAPTGQRFGRVVLGGAALRCDCHLFQFARALVDRPEHVVVEGLACGDGPWPRTGDALDALACPLPRAHCWPGCACALRPARGVRAGCGPRCGVVAACPAPPARAPPALPPPLALAELALRNVSTRRLPAAAALPRGLRALDLRDNRIERAPRAAAQALFALPHLRLRLAGNPLSCACGDRDLVDVLLENHDRVDGLSETRCADGGPLSALGAECAPGGAVVGALAVLAGAALAAAALAALLARPELRLRLKACLYARGLRLRWLAEADDDEERPYDAFVSYSHRDERFVVEQLVARLEAGPRPYRLCLHYRDWAVGEWIPAQIAASVRRSRRTLVVLSPHFVASQWARAEFREAHAAALREARPRLLVVLLGEPPADLEPELRGYLSTTTYVRWGDPWFWEKLLYAMPHRPRAAERRPAASPSAPAPPPPPAPPHAPPPVPPPAPPPAPPHAAPAAA